MIEFTTTSLPDPPDPYGSRKRVPAARLDESPGRARNRERCASLADTLLAWLRRVTGRPRPEARAVERISEITNLLEAAILTGEASAPPLELACEGVAAALDAGLVAVLLPGDDAGPAFGLRACRGPRSELAAGIDLEMEGSTIGTAILAELPVILGVQELSQGPPAERALAELGQLVVLPLTDQGDRIGLLLVGGGSAIEGGELFLALDQLGEKLGSIVAEHARQREVGDRLLVLEQANRKLIRHQRESEIFLATAIHELRTPLSGIVSYAEVLADYHDTLSDEERRKFLTTLNVQCKTIMGLVDQLFDFARLESGKLTLDTESTRVSELVRAAVNAMTPVAAKRGLTLESHIPDLGPAALDPTKIRQCVLNLLSNAMKFTPAPGTITVHLSAGAGGIEIKVKDTGKGIPPGELERVFDLFHTVEGRSTGRSLGLGLYLVKSFVELHGGTMLVESEPGKGSTFGFAIPWSPPEVGASGQSSAA